jgi:2,5-diketo-D-gluconate reductase B
MDTIITRGVSIPRLGFGTFRMPGGGCQPVVESALALGYRHLDTAATYENEDAVGAAIAALPKDQRYLTPPFAPDWNAPTL